MLAARLNLYLRILERTVAKASFPGFLPVGFAEATVGGAIRPLRPGAHVIFDKIDHIKNQIEPCSFKKCEAKLPDVIAFKLPLQGTYGSQAVELESKVNDPSRLSQEYPRGRFRRAGVHDLVFK